MTMKKILAVILVMSGAVSCVCCGTRDVAEKPGDSEWIALFNGTDLSGWTEEGRAAWTVEDGCLVGRQGPNGAPGDLFPRLLDIDRQYLESTRGETPIDRLGGPQLLQTGRAPVGPEVDQQPTTPLGRRHLQRHLVQGDQPEGGNRLTPGQRLRYLLAAGEEKKQEQRNGVKVSVHHHTPCICRLEPSTLQADTR